MDSLSIVFLIMSGVVSSMLYGLAIWMLIDMCNEGMNND